MSLSSVNTREIEQSQYGQPGTSSATSTMFPTSPVHPPGPSPGLSTSSSTHAPYSPIAPSPQLSSYGQPGPEKPPPPLQRGRPPDPVPPMSPSSSSSRDRPPAPRRPYHPNPPAHRSEWVMWAGNVPADATHDELWRFFNSPPTPGSSGAQSAGAHSTQSAPAGPVSSSTTGSTASTDSVYGGVSSIFLIARSNCAFVNFQSEIHLHAAIRHFNGVPLRAGDPRCPRLVCRVRGREDDLKAGVGGQRGSGIHVRWVKDKKEREREAARRRSASMSSEQVTTPSSSPTDAAGMMAVMSLSSDEDAAHGRRVRKPEPHSSSSGSYASTNSSILTTYFPKRYFILKSLTQFDLDLSVEKGLWATQRHNEGILDQAYRTSKEVYLIFSVNKSGEFYGYAKMAGPISRGEQRVSWASRTDSPQQRSSLQAPRDSPTARREREPTFFSPSEQRYGESPNPMSPETHRKLGAPAPFTATPVTKPSEQPERNASAPAEMLQPHRTLSQLTDGPQTQQQQSFDIHNLRGVAPLIANRKQESLPEGIELDRSAPFRAMRDPRAIIEAARKTEDSPLHSVAEEDERTHVDEDRGKGKGVDRPRQDSNSAPGPSAPAAGAGAAQEDGPVWGESFKVEWVRTERLPFTRTRHLRNPWNHDREVKVSRDGTELEPSVGQALLDEWDRLEEPAAQATGTGNVEVSRRVAGKASISVDVLSTSESASAGPARTRKTGEGG
ncbi:YT521-B-like domain-containing protein [Daedaleopsis nitida]|nr:YT521-B-like domain-containing protein [Daedaleopsis nitida]